MFVELCLCGIVCMRGVCVCVCASVCVCGVGGGGEVGCWSVKRFYFSNVMMHDVKQQFPAIFSNFP